jgi:hypothetical protein
MLGRIEQVTCRIRNEIFGREIFGNPQPVVYEERIFPTLGPLDTLRIGLDIAINLENLHRLTILYNFSQRILGPGQM